MTELLHLRSGMSIQGASSGCLLARAHRSGCDVPHLANKSWTGRPLNRQFPPRDKPHIEGVDPRPRVCCDEDGNLSGFLSGAGCTPLGLGG